MAGRHHILRARGFGPPDTDFSILRDFYSPGCKSLFCLVKWEVSAITREERCKSFLLRFGCLAAVALLVFMFLRYLFRPLLPFIIAFAVTALLRPVYLKLSARFRLRRKFWAVVSVVVFYLLLVGIAAALLVGLLSAVIDWAGSLPDMFNETLSPWLSGTVSNALLFAARFDPEVAALVENMLPDAISTVGGTIMDFSVSLVGWASSVGTKLPGALLAVVICVIATVFTAVDYDEVWGTMLSALPSGGRRIFDRVQKAFRNIAFNFLRSYTLILLITFGEVALGLLLIGFDNAVFIAALIALFDILPIVGSGMVLLPWTIFKFIQGDITKGIGLAILYVVVIVVRQVIEPKIVSKRMGLHPLVTLSCMWVGLKTMGGAGMFGLPLLVITMKDLKESGVLDLRFFTEPGSAGGSS